MRGYFLYCSLLSWFKMNKKYPLQMMRNQMIPNYFVTKSPLACPELHWQTVKSLLFKLFKYQCGTCFQCYLIQCYLIQNNQPVTVRATGWNQGQKLLYLFCFFFFDYSWEFQLKTLFFQQLILRAPVWIIHQLNISHRYFVTNRL